MLFTIASSSLRKRIQTLALLVIFFQFTERAHSQTETDAILMNKNQFCTGLVGSYSSWDHYWEGTWKRNNLNLGKVSTQSLTWMANYGITNRLNVMVGIPYIKTRASAGTLRGLEGFQDISLNVKWKAHSLQKGNHRFSLFLVGGASTPSSNYVIDHLPLSIGLGSTNITGRLLVDYVYHRFFVTAGGSFTWRSNVKLDRTSYFDTELHSTNEVEMPHQLGSLVRTGIRSKYLIAEALLSTNTTLGGFDITRNNMPFPSNRMNGTQLGISLKYTLPVHTNLSFLAGANHIISGRNAGQATGVNAGIFYAFYLKKQGGKNDNNTTVLP